MTEGIKVPSRQEASEWIDDLSEKSGKVLDQVKSKITRRKEEKTLGAFLRRNKFLPILLGLAAIVAVIAVTRSRQASTYSLYEELDVTPDGDF